MKDREPTKILPNGALRYGVYDDNGALLRYEYIKPEDEPTEEGTPLNKATLLSDATAEKVWPNPDNRPDDPTVNQALAKLTEPGAKIGDIQITSRNDLGTSWLKCDGNLIGNKDYPELYDALRTKSVNPDWRHNFSIKVKRSDVGVRIEYGDGLYVAVCGDSTYYVSTDPLNSWIKYKTGDVGTELTLYDIKFANGIWVAAGSSSKTDTYAPIFTSDDPRNGFTIHNRETLGFNQNVSYKFEFIDYHNGAFVAAGDSMLIKAEIPNEKWKIIENRRPDGIDIFPLFFKVVGDYIVLTSNYSGDNSIYFYEDVESIPIRVQFDKTVQSVGFSDGKWLAILNSTYYISQNPLLNSSWGKKTISWNNTGRSDITVHNGRFYIVISSYYNGPYRVLSTDSPENTGSWKNETSFNGQVEGKSNTENIISVNNKLIVGISYGNYSENDLGIIAAADYSQLNKMLPKINISDGASAYIKALEE